MISSEGYKAFRGTMRITPKNPNMEPFDLTCDWLYKPEYQCWYGKGSSFMEEICTVLVDLTAPLPNTPLTLEELREMDGEPVWIERCGSDSPEDKEWALVFVKGGFCRTSVGNIAYFALYGIGWLAYRRKPEKG